MKKIKELWPDQKLILVCRKGVGEFFLKTQMVDEVLEIQKNDGESYRKALRALKETEIDRVISPHESVRTAFFVQKLKAKQKIGFAKPWNGFFFSNRISKNHDLPEVIRQLTLLQGIDESLRGKIQKYSEEANPHGLAKNGKLSATPEWASMNLRAFYSRHKNDIVQALAKVNLNEITLSKSVAFFPGSVWATKRWTEEGFIQIGQSLSNQGVPIIIMGGPGEEELCARIAKQIPEALDICARTSVYEAALILSKVAALVGNDSASMHLAATAETPSVVIFGPTVLEFGFRPWQDHAYVVEKQGLTCRPCGKHGHNKCPIKTHLCMKQISQDEVLAKLQGVLHEN